MTRFSTDYHGIVIQHENGHWWLMSDDGDESYVGTRPPTAGEIDEFTFGPADALDW